MRVLSKFLNGCKISLCEYCLILLGISLAMCIKLLVRILIYLRHIHFLKDFQIKRICLRTAVNGSVEKTTLDFQNLWKIGWSESKAQSHPLISMCALQCVQHPTCIKIKNSHINNSDTFGSMCFSVSNWVFNASLLMFLHIDHTAYSLTATN